MPHHIVIVRGTYDPAQLAPGVEFGMFVAREIRADYPHFEGIETFIDAEALQFLWALRFGIPPGDLQKPIFGDVAARILGYVERAKEASIAVEMIESSQWLNTYMGRGERMSRGLADIGIGGQPPRENPGTGLGGQPPRGIPDVGPGG